MTTRPTEAQDQPLTSGDASACGGDVELGRLGVRCSDGQTKHAIHFTDIAQHTGEFNFHEIHKPMGAGDYDKLPATLPPAKQLLDPNSFATMNLKVSRADAESKLIIVKLSPMPYARPVHIIKDPIVRARCVPSIGSRIKPAP